MRKIKSKERPENGDTYCPYCKPEKVRAIWRRSGFIDFRTEVACDKHKHLIEEEPDDDHMTEADYQTWWRL